MDAALAGTALFLMLIVALGAGMWVFISMIFVSFLGLSLFLGFPPDRIGAIAKGVIWRSLTTWELAAIPMFIFMGEIILRTDLSERLFRGLSVWVRYLPGGLLHTNVFGSTIFSAVCGSSTATTAIVGRITSRELAARSYSRELSLGSLAGAGTLGLLIPPSIMLIIYGILAEVSIAKLFIAGILPGIMIALLFSGYIVVRCMADRSLAPTLTDVDGGGHARALLDVLPVLLLVAIVFGGIYSGMVTPSESAALGIAATLLVAAAYGQLKPTLLGSALLATIPSSAMICTIIAAASLLSSTIGFLHVPTTLVSLISALDLSPGALILILAVFYVLLGLFLDGISISVMTLPVTLPLILAAGIDPLWFGIFLVIVIEVGLITPPLGLNLFVLQNVTGEDLVRLSRAAVPFFILLLLAAAIITVFPQIVLFLPAGL